MNFSRNGYLQILFQLAVAIHIVIVPAISACPALVSSSSLNLAEKRAAVFNRALQGHKPSRLAVVSAPGLFSDLIATASASETRWIPVNFHFSEWHQTPIYKLEELAIEAQNIFDQISPHPLERKTTGIEGPAVVVVTHQTGLADITRTLLSNSRLSQLPRIFLVDYAFPLRSPELAAMASQLIYSHAGEMDRDFTVRDLYLAGGYATICMSTTFRQFLDRALKTKQRNLTVHILENATYGGFERSELFPTLAMRSPELKYKLGDNPYSYLVEGADGHMLQLDVRFE